MKTMAILLVAAILTFGAAGPLPADTLTLDYSTYIGGSGYDFGTGVAVDPAGNLYLTGDSESGDFPTQDCYQANYGGNQDAFIAKLSPTGSSLIFSTYLGGSSVDNGVGNDLQNT